MMKLCQIKSAASWGQQDIDHRETRHVQRLLDDEAVEP